jgi:enolase
MSAIISITAREVLDSRGNPTVEVEARTRKNAAAGIAPSGASTGSLEALELRDGGKRYAGKGVLKAVDNVRTLLAPALVGMDAQDLEALDRAMIEADGTPNKSRAGANATTAASFALAQLGALEKGVALHEHLAPRSGVLPVPMMNVINGGKHAGGKLRIQEFMISPCGLATYHESLRAGVEVYHALKAVLRRKYGAMAINVGDEGGFAPPLDSSREALDILVEAISEAGYAPGRDVCLAMDAAASEFYSDGGYDLDGRRWTPAEMVDFYVSLAKDYPMVSMEDPFHEAAMDTMAELTVKVGARVQLVGDDMFVTQSAVVRKAIAMKAGNCMLLKVNQVGTITEAFDAARVCSAAGYGVMVSHRSGEAEDTTIADIAVALGCGQIKTGAPCRAERTCKYNRLLRIESSLARPAFLGARAFKR